MQISRNTPPKTAVITPMMIDFHQQPISRARLKSTPEATASRRSASMTFSMPMTMNIEIAIVSKINHVICSEMMRLPKSATASTARKVVTR